MSEESDRHPPDRSRRTVLIVDDDPLICRTLANYLDGGDWLVRTAADGEKALASLAQAPVDIVVTDILMPNRDGIETIRGARAAHPGTRIVAMSGGSRIASFDYLDIADRLGADATLHKPFTREQFLAALQPDD